MAWNFNGVDQWVNAAGDNIALPNGDWTIAGWINSNSYSGILFQYFFSMGFLAANPSLNMNYGEVSSAVPGTFSYYIWGISGGDSFQPATSDLHTSFVGVWAHLCIARDSGTARMFLNGAQVHSAAMTGPQAVTNTSLDLGRRSDGNPDRYADAKMAEWAKWDSYLGVGNIAALAAGFSPSMVRRPSWYISMRRSFVAEAGSLAITNNAATVSAHPRIIYPRSKKLYFGPSAGGIYTLSSSAGSFGLSGIAALQKITKTAAAGAYTLTGVATVLSKMLVVVNPYARYRNTDPVLSASRRLTASRLTVSRLWQKMIRRP